MSHSAEIDKAIAAHGSWKARLRSAIETGKSEFTVEKVRTDNQCDFGKWLYSLPSSELGSEFGKKVKALHAQFHVQAAKVLDLALTSKKKEAEEAMTTTSDFGKTSAELTLAMVAWKKASA